MNPTIRHILVLCEGNHCRSPLAEAMLRQALGSDFTVHSAGLGALVNHPAHEEAQRIMAEQGIDLPAHRGCQLTPELALAADLILVMDQAQKESCERRIPSTRGRVFLLGHWLAPGAQEILDPIQRDPGVHRQVFEHIQRAILPWLPRLNPPLRTP